MLQASGTRDCGIIPAVLLLYLALGNGCGSSNAPSARGYGGGVSGATSSSVYGSVRSGGASSTASRPSVVQSGGAHNASGGVDSASGGAHSASGGAHTTSSRTEVLSSGAGGGSKTGLGGASANGAAGARAVVSVDFQPRAPGIYTQQMAGEDFAGEPTWNDGLDDGRATVIEESGEQRFLRVTYAAGVYGPTDGGVQFLVPLDQSYTELYLSYRIRFAPGFDFVRGGKLPGLVGGTHPTGCVADTGGFSARMMWRSGGASVQYLYFPEKVNSCGDDYPYRIGAASVVFVPGKWHRVQHRIRMNTNGNHDGILQAWFDGELALDEQAFIYRIASESFGIDALYFSTFFGGSDASWAPASAQNVDFDDFIISEQPIE